MQREATDRDWFTVQSGGEQCTPYTSDYNQFYDTNFKAAQGLGLTTWIVGFIMVIVVWSVAPCVATPKVGWRIIGGMFFLMGGCQLFTLLFLASNICSSGGCILKNGGVVSIFAFLFWWAAAGICFLIPDATRERDVGLPQSSPQRAAAAAVGGLVQQSETPIVVMATESTTQRVEADGTIVAETVKNNPDGSTTVTTSIIPPAAVAQVPDVQVTVPASVSGRGNPNSVFEKR